ncbi:MAG: hypothetical protein C5B55_15030, partial [Blastocatellia bacterium]
MKMKLALLALLMLIACARMEAKQTVRSATITLQSSKLKPVSGEGSLKIEGLFYETASGKTLLPASLTAKISSGAHNWSKQVTTADGRTITVSVTPTATDFNINLKSQPDADIVKWGLTIEEGRDEYFTGLMERVVDGPQIRSWEAGIQQAMNLRGEKVEMIVKPTTSIYAPFYLSSRGYAAFVKGDWPGFYDFGVTEPDRVKIEFEGPAFELKIYTASDPATLVRAHALDAGPPFMPPKWMFSPWRWRDEHTQRTTYYDGTPVTAPFNSEVMEDVLMMHAFGIPNGVYWIDRPWGPGKPWGYDDFEIDEHRLPNFGEMVKWFESRNTKTVLWIAPFFQGKMMHEALAKGYTLAGQVRPLSGNNYPMVDLSNPAAKAYWQ